MLSAEMVITKSSLVRTTWRLFAIAFDCPWVSKTRDTRRCGAIFGLPLTVTNCLC